MLAPHRGGPKASIIDKLRGHLQISLRKPLVEANFTDRMIQTCIEKINVSFYSLSPC